MPGAGSGTSATAPSAKRVLSPARSRVQPPPELLASLEKLRSRGALGARESKKGSVCKYSLYCTSKRDRGGWKRSELDQGNQFAVSTLPVTPPSSDNQGDPIWG